MSLLAIWRGWPRWMKMLSVAVFLLVMVISYLMVILMLPPRVFMVVESNPPLADVQVYGNPIGNTPAEVRLSAPQRTEDFWKCPEDYLMGDHCGVGGGGGDLSIKVKGWRFEVPCNARWKEQDLVLDPSGFRCVEFGLLQVLTNTFRVHVRMRRHLWGSALNWKDGVPSLNGDIVQRLGFTQKETREADLRIAEAYREYATLEASHLQRTWENGRLKILFTPFPAEGKALKQKLEASLGQAFAPWDRDDLLTLLDMSLIFWEWGDADGTLDLWREGDVYHYLGNRRVSLRLLGGYGVPFSGSGPGLPDSLRCYWEEPKP